MPINQSTDTWVASLPPHARDVLPDLSQELAEMGRGSLQRRILRLEAELKAAMERIRELEVKVSD